MGKDTSGGAVSGGVAGIGQLPSFTLPTAGGGQVRSWDFKSRTALVLWLAGASPSERAVRLVAAKEPDVLGAPAALLIIVRGPLAQAEAVRRLGRIQEPILADVDGRVHRRLGATHPTLMVTDRHGTLYWRAEVRNGRPDMDEALSWLDYISILEPECGSCVPAWPVEE